MQLYTNDNVNLRGTRVHSTWKNSEGAFHIYAG